MLEKWITVDFETVSACDLKVAGAYRYAEDVTTEILCLAWETPTAQGVWYPGDPIPIVLKAAMDDPFVLFVAHHAAFEKAIWRNIMVPLYGWPYLPNNRWHDTMAVCAMKALPQKLDQAARVLDLTNQKDTKMSKVVVGYSKAKKGYYGKIDLDATGRYCLQDVFTETNLHRRIGDLSPGERYVWLLDQRINERGIRLDLPYISAAQSIVAQATAPLAEEFRAITGGLEFTQTVKVRDWANARGAGLPNLQKATLTEVLGDDIDQEDDLYDDDRVSAHLAPEVHRALSIRQLVGSAAVKKLARMDRCVCRDGRARGIIQYHGAASGRFAGRLFQPHNFPTLTGRVGKEAIDPALVIEAMMTRDPEWLAEIVGLPPVQAVVSGLRHAIVSEEGYEFDAGDYSGVEARILLAISGQTDKANMMRDGIDVYCDMAKDIFGYPINKKEHPFERDIGKRSVLGLGYGMGRDKFHRTYAKDQTDGFCEKVVRTYRKIWAPCVPKFWYGLEEASTLAVWNPGVAYEAFGIVYQVEGEWLTARLPSGRKLWYHGPTKCNRQMPWDPLDIRPGWYYYVQKMGQWRRVYAYGGGLTGETIQAIARDILVGSMFRCERENMPIVLTVHDENVTETRYGSAEKDKLRQIMVDVEPWVKALGIPITVECWKGERYRK